MASSLVWITNFKESDPGKKYCPVMATNSYERHVSCGISGWHPVLTSYRATSDLLTKTRVFPSVATMYLLMLESHIVKEEIDVSSG